MKHIKKKVGKDISGDKTHVYSLYTGESNTEFELLFFQRCHPYDKGSALVTVKKETNEADVETWVVLSREVLLELVQVIQRECEVC